MKTQTRKNTMLLKMKAEAGVRHLKARTESTASNQQEPGGARRRPPPEPSEGAWPCGLLDFRVPASRAVRQ